MKKQFITRVFLSSLVLALTSLFGGGNLLAQKFYESFDKCTSTGGNDDKWTGSIAPKAISNSNTDKSGWKFVKGYAASKCAKFGSKSDLGSATTPALNFEGDATLTFKAGAWKGDKTTLNISILNGGSLSAKTVEMASGDWSEHEIAITGATINSKIKFEGNKASNSRFFLDEVKITQASSGGSGDPDDTKTDPNLAYRVNSVSVSEYNATIGQDNTFPVLTYADGVTDTDITYSSSDKTVATVDEKSGNVTLTGEGKTTITACFPGNETYAAGSASYELTVKKPNVFVYKKVTSAEDLIKGAKKGAKYVFVCEGTNKVGTAVSDTKMQPTNATLTDGILEESVDEPMEFVLDIKDGKYCFISGGKYLKGANSTDLTMATYKTTDEAIKWNILFDEVKGALIWNTYGANNGTGRRLMYRAGTYNVFGHYASAIDNKEYYNVQLYQKVYPLTVSEATQGYATFYNEEEAYQMPAGLTGYAVTKAENGNCITRTTAYEASATVPAKTPLLIIGQANSYYPAVVSGDGVTTTYEGSNLLEGARDAEGKTLSDNDGDVYYYKLGLNTKGVPGFYWGAANGAAFKMTKATTAYLAVPQTIANGANALFFDFGGETGINEIQTEQADKAIFDLSGRRVQKATKGFYIVGGKKVLVK